MTTIKLQKTTENDWKLVSNIKEAAVSNTFHANLGEEAIKKYLRDFESYFITHEDKIVGIIGYRPEPEINGYYIGELIVMPEYKGRGFGKDAMQLVLEMIGDHPVRLVTHPENSSAICLYLKLGFKIKAWKDNYYNDGEPRIVMIKN